MIEPITRKEMIMSGMDLKPITRQELFLAKAAGMDVETPEPITREEMFLSRIKGDSSSGGSSGSTPVIVAMTITENGTYNAPEGVYGYNPVTVEVASTGGGGTSTGGSVSKKDVNFYDYDGTLLHSYTVAEAQALTELPELPEREGLICQGWNWTMEDIKAHNRAVDVGATYTTDDGTTRIYIHLEDGRTSPMLGVCPNGTVTVDWGDGTTPDVLTGTNAATLKYTPRHEYAKPGDYVIRLTVDGELGFTGSNGGSYILSDTENVYLSNSYRNSIKKIEIGKNVKRLSSNAFCCLYSLESISISADVNTIANGTFVNGNIAFVNIPNGVTSIPSDFSKYNYVLIKVIIPNSVTSIGQNAFMSCKALRKVIIPNNVTSINKYAFSGCSALSSIVIPDSVTSIGNQAFDNCSGISNAVMSKNLKNIASQAFNSCSGVRYFDFTKHTEVPALASSTAFNGVPVDCEIRVPAALYDEWIAATNWATYASQIVAV